MEQLEYQAAPPPRIYLALLQTKYRQLLLGERDAKLRLQSNIIQQ